MAERIRLRRTRGWRMPPGAIKADRSTPLGNPFRVGGPNLLGWGLVRDPAHSVWLFRQWLVTPSRSIVVEVDRHDAILQALPGLAGRDLACWCRLGAPCHVDVLLELAARPDIAQVVHILLHTTEPLSSIERAIALAQLARLTGAQPSDIPAIGSAITELVRKARSAPGAMP